ncbi:MAG: polysaccharide deacetylase family protein [Clostridiales bacterium]|nr:polysaccharide deacetylase family protein [Clostridiales bacterium]
MGKRVVALLLMMVLAVLVAAPALASEDYPAKVAKGPLHLRKRPEKNAPSLGRYKSGATVYVQADGEVFCKVTTQDGKEGYMMKEYLTFEQGLPPMEALPEPTPDLTREQALARGIDPNKPMIALTFDDGPQPESLVVLEALNAHGAKGTFFVLGKNIAGNEEILRKIAEGGHQIASHSWSHPNFREISESAVLSQMERSMEKILEITGQRVTMMRPPYGATNRISRRPMVQLDLPIILWSVDSLDWKTRSASATVDSILNQAANGAIVLCHDVWNTTGEAMKDVVPALIAKGYQLVTVAEMMSFRKEPLKPGWEYKHLDPKNIEAGITPAPQSTPEPEGQAKGD